MILRHRYAVLLPLVLVVVATVVGGILNSVDARVRIIDDLTDKGVKGAKITHGLKVTTTDDNGEFVLPSVPRTSKYQIDASGYFRTSAPMTAEEVRLKANSVTIYVYDETKTPDDRIKNPQARQGETKDGTILATGTDSGQMTVTPHPGKDAKLFICAEGFEPKVITVEGVLMQIGLKPGGAGCPPQASPSPSPGATPSPSGPAPSPGPTPSP